MFIFRYGVGEQSSTMVREYYNMRLVVACELIPACFCFRQTPSPPAMRQQRYVTQVINCFFLVTSSAKLISNFLQYTMFRSYFRLDFWNNNINIWGNSATAALVDGNFQNDFFLVGNCSL